MKYIGLNIHKKDTPASVLDEKGRFVHGERIRTDVKDIGPFFEKMERMNDDDLLVVIEATGFYFWIYDVIAERGHQAKVVHPTRVKPLMRARTKNARNDALMLAELLRMGCLEGIYVPDREVREMRELTRHRGALVRKKGEFKREIISALDQRGVNVPEEHRTNFSQ